jgi:hypothetical protein
VSEALYLWVRDGAVAAPPPRTVFAGGRERLTNPFPRPNAIGAVRIARNDPDALLAALGAYRLAVVARGAAPGEDYAPTVGAPVVDPEAGTVTYTEGWALLAGTARADWLAARWAEQARTRDLRDARAALARPLTNEPGELRAQLAAVKTLLERQAWL